MNEGPENDLSPVYEITSVGATPEVAARLLLEHERLQALKFFEDAEQSWPPVGTTVDINL